MKKTISTILILCMALTSMIGMFAFPTSAAVNWPVTDDNTPDIYEINNADELQAFVTQLNAGTTFAGKTIALTDDIDYNPNFDGTAADAADVTRTWPSMTDGENSTVVTKFEGSIDGRGHTISGIYYTAGYRGNDRGMFAATGAANTVLENFTIARSYITIQRWRQSALINHIGTGTLTIDGVNVANDVIFDQPTTNNWAAGGNTAFYVGKANSGAGLLTISNCVFSGTVNTYRESCGTAAFVGRAETNVVIRNCAMYGTVNSTGTSAMGVGIIAQQAVGTATISDVIVAGNVQTYDESGITKAKHILGTHNANIIVNVSNVVVVDDENVTFATGGANIEEETFVKVSELTGISAQATLNEVGITGFAASAIGLPVLKGTAVKNEVANAATKYEGYQVRKNANGTMDVRLVGSIHADIEDIKNYEAVGFTVVAYYQNDAAAKVQAKDLAKTQVYTSVIADGVEWTPAETLEDTYLFVHGFKGIATDKGPVVFEITTFYTDANGATVVGGTNTVTVSAN